MSIRGLGRDRCYLRTVVLTIIKHNTRLAPLLAERSEGWAYGFWSGEVEGEMESFGRAIFGVERAGCEGDAVAFGLEGCGGAEADVLACSDDEGDWFGHGCWVGGGGKEGVVVEKIGVSI
jgi:hypothetical protein